MPVEMYYDYIQSEVYCFSILLSFWTIRYIVKLLNILPLFLESHSREHYEKCVHRYTFLLLMYLPTNDKSCIYSLQAFLKSCLYCSKN